MKYGIGFCLTALLTLASCGKEEEEPLPPEPAPAKPSFGMGSLGSEGGGGNVTAIHTVGIPQGELAVPVGDTQAGFNMTVSAGDDQPKPEAIVSTSTNVLEINVGEDEDAGAANPLTEKRRDGLVMVIPTPTGSLASKLKPEGKTILWRPMKRSGGEFLGMPWLVTATFNEDRSVLAVVERTGADAGPYGSRVVLINTCDFTILRVIEIDALVVRLALCDARTSLFALTAPQKSLIQPARLMEVGLDKGDVLQTLDLPGTTVQHFFVASKQGKAFIRKTGADQMSVYPLSQLADTAMETVRLEDANAVPALTFDDRTFAVFTPGQYALYDYADLSVFKTMALPGNAMYANVWCVGGRDRWIVEEDGRFVYLNNGQAVPVPGEAGGFAFGDPGSDRIYLEEKVGNVITGYRQMPFAPVGTKIEPLRLFPRSAASAFFVDYCPHGSRILYFDKAGTLWVYAHPPKKESWAKVKVLSPDS